MLSFRQFLECNDVDTSSVSGEELGNLNWHYEPAYRMYCNAIAHESQKDFSYRAYVPSPASEDIHFENPPSQGIFKMKGYFTNEDFADYVVCITLMYYHREIKVSKQQLTEIINFYYYKFCDLHHLQPQPLVPIRALDKMNLPQ